MNLALITNAHKWLNAIFRVKKGVWVGKIGDNQLASECSVLLREMGGGHLGLLKQRKVGEALIWREAE